MAAGRFLMHAMPSTRSTLYATGYACHAGGCEMLGNDGCQSGDRGARRDVEISKLGMCVEN